MVHLVAESIPPEVQIWATLWLTVLTLSILAIFLVVTYIARQRARRLLGGGRKRSDTDVDPWAESARRLEMPGPEDNPPPTT